MSAGVFSGPLQRMLAMDRAELRFRAQCEARKFIDRTRHSVAAPHWRRQAFNGCLAGRSSIQSPELAACRAAAGRGDWGAAHRLLAEHIVRRKAAFPLRPGRLGPLAARINARFPRAAQDAADRADRMRAGRYDVLGYRDRDFGSPPRWNYDPVCERTAPPLFWASVPYLDPACGDHKVIWEINRHQHFLALGRAFHLTGDRRYYDTFVRQLEDWLQHNPPLRGTNWASMLELAFRSLSWLWALHFFAPAAAGDGADAPPWTIDLVVALDRQLTHVEQNLSRYFSPNTHLTGEALALYVAGMSLPELASSSRWADVGRRVLIAEATRQVLDDGGHAELSSHYHRYSTDFYLLACTVAAAGSDDRLLDFRSAAERQAGYLRILADDEGRLPLFGDDDGGQLFPIARRPSIDCRDTLATASVLFGRPDLRIGSLPEETLWWCGTGVDADALDDVEPGATALTSTALRDTGYYVMRARHGDRLVFDAGPHGFLNGGHAHADALSVVVTAAGQPLLVDPGTATYTMDAELRDRFRSTAMHNTVVVAGRPQSEPLGPFHWRTRASARAPIWRAERTFDYVEGLHDGYAPLIHARAILSLTGIGWVIVDHLLGDGSIESDAYWHFDPRWNIVGLEGGAARLAQDDGRQTAVACSVPLESLAGGVEGLDRCALEYGRVEPAPCLRARTTGSLPRSFATLVSARGALISIAAIPVEVPPSPAWHAVAFRLSVEGRLADLLIAVERNGEIGDANGPGETWGAGGLRTDGRVALSGLDFPSVLINGRTLASSVHPPASGIAGTSS